MKKKVIMGLLIVLFIGVVFSGDMHGSNWIYTNNNGVEIDEALFKKLEGIGYSKDDIADLSKDKIDSIIKMDIVETTYKETKIEENKKIDNECNSMISSRKLNTMKLSSWENGEEVLFTDDDGGKTLKTYVTKYKSGNDYKVFIRQILIWDNTPKKRYSDILTISYLDGMSLESINGYSNVNMSVSYDLTKYSKVGWKNKEPKYKVKTTTTRETFSYSGVNKDMYNHVLGDYFAFKFKLPEDTYTNGSSRRYYMIYKNTYTNFRISMESTFITNSNNITGTSFQSHYVHQTGSGEFDWGKISFTSTKPFITYQTDFWIDDPSYDQALFNDINVRF